MKTFRGPRNTNANYWLLVVQAPRATVAVHVLVVSALVVALAGVCGSFSLALLLTGGKNGTRKLGATKRPIILRMRLRSNFIAIAFAKIETDDIIFLSVFPSVAVEWNKSI